MKNMDIGTWQDFKVAKLFKIKLPLARSMKDYAVEGKIPYVSTKSVNNGVAAYYALRDGEKLEKGNCITVNPLDGTAFFQEKDFLARGGAGSAITILYNENLTKYSALFICTIIKLSSKRFNYNDALNGKNLAALSLRLPVRHNEDGSVYDKEKHYSDDGYVPDWSYMDQYMKNMEQKATERINLLKKVVNKTEGISPCCYSL